MIELFPTQVVELCDSSECGKKIMDCVGKQNG